MADARRQFDFFAASARPGPGFCTLDHAGQPLPDDLQELHTTTRLVHSYALGQAIGVPGAEAMIDRGMAYLWSHHRDADHGGYNWGLAGMRWSMGASLPMAMSLSCLPAPARCRRATPMPRA
ncbi:AGE family epimerase/isomerase [Gemmobacter lanyuensis]